MQSGNVLIYFKEEQVNDERPVPQIRAELDVLENSGSTWLSNALLYGRIDDNDDDWSLPESSTSAAQSPNFPVPPGGGRRMLAPTSGGRSPPPFDIDQTYYGVPSNRSSARPLYFSETDLPSAQSPPPLFRQTDPQRPTHELWFTAPAHLKTPQAQRLHHVAVRNFLAMLHNKPIVGSDMFTMLTTLQSELQVMYDLDDDDHSRISSRERSVQMITNYLINNKFDDVRISIKVALSLLAWAEQDNVKWRQGYLECFVHLAGILNPSIEGLPDFLRLSIVTRRNLGIAAKSLELRIMDAEELLTTFDFGEVWGDPTKVAGSPIYQSYQNFRQFLISHYTKVYRAWPPERGKTWLNRKVVADLQEDFGALYDYLVDREVVWDPREERPGKKWEMINRRTSGFKADLPGLPLTDMLVTFDSAHGFLHIPHPYPLLPREVPQSKAPPKKSLFGGLKKSKTDTSKDAKTHLQLSIIYSDATNMEKLDSSFKGESSSTICPKGILTIYRKHPNRRLRALRTRCRLQKHIGPRSTPRPLDPPLRRPPSPLQTLRRRSVPQILRRRPLLPLHRLEALSRVGHKRPRRASRSHTAAIVLLAARLGPDTATGRARRTRWQQRAFR